MKRHTLLERRNIKKAQKAHVWDVRTGQETLASTQTCTIIQDDYLWHRTRQNKTRHKPEQTVQLDTQILHSPLHNRISEYFMCGHKEHIKQ